MSGIALIYHFTKKTNLELIFKDGLIPQSKFMSLGSKLREGANYFWLAPSNDCMGYVSDDEYACLEVSVNADDCIVVNMDMISAAFYNFVMGKEGLALHDCAELVRLHDATAVAFNFYAAGQFRSPEVIILGLIPPERIRAVDPRDITNKFDGNRNIYDRNLEKRLFGLISDGQFADVQAAARCLEERKVIKKVARHDDSSGLLESYLTADGSEFFTIHASEEFSQSK